MYYLHVLTPEDESLRESLEQTRQQSKADDGPSNPVIPRKPLPSSLSSKEQARLSYTEPSKAGPVSIVADGPEKPVEPLITGKAADESNDQIGGTTAGATAERIIRKPIGPRPLPPSPQTPLAGVSRKPLAENASAPKHSIDSINEAQSHPAWSRPTALDGVRDGPERNSSSTRRAVTEAGGQHPLPQDLPIAPLADNTKVKDHQITLIRRDPSSAGQWNIGTLTVGGLDSPTSVEISGPGYQKFVGRIDSEHLENLQSEIDALRQRTKGPGSKYDSVNSEIAPTATKPSAVSGPKIFKRDLTISFPSQTRTRHRASSSASDPFQSPNRPRRTSSPSKTSRLRNAHFSFQSPWNGTCTFSTGINGRSLKCRHTLPNNSTSATETGGNAPAAPIAEIRFNLPWAVAVGKQSMSSSEGGGAAAPISLRGGDFQTEGPRQHFPSRPSLANAFNKVAAADRHSASSAAKASFRQSWQKIKDLSLNRESDEETDTMQQPPAAAPSHHPPPPPPPLPPRPPKLTTTPTTTTNPTRPDPSSLAPLSSSTSPQQPRSSTDDPDPEAATATSLLDLTLGREKAGGGMRGRSAKLGKLVIENEGLKMCDLTVAMCMAVWWMYYT